jgi:hypothetical protein
VARPGARLYESELSHSRVNCRMLCRMAGADVDDGDGCEDVTDDTTLVL